MDGASSYSYVLYIQQIHIWLYDLESTTEYDH